jgi:hypothetical protein
MNNCSTCKFWKRNKYFRPKTGRCLKLKKENKNFWKEDGTGFLFEIEMKCLFDKCVKDIHTNENFGCIFHDEKTKL